MALIPDSYTIFVSVIAVVTKSVFTVKVVLEVLPSESANV